MATTATLNGGPTGGLHATPSLIHSDNPPQEDTCRVDSNSSFESGHEDHHMHTNSGVESGERQQHIHTWNSSSSPSGTNEILLNTTPKSNPLSSSYFMDMDVDKASSSEAFQGNSKKRRKQSRPVRIPASELLDSAGLPMVVPPEEGEGPQQQNQTITQRGEKLEEGQVDEFRENSLEDGSLRPSHQSHHHRSHHHHIPLNLSSRNENSSSGDEQNPSRQIRSSSSSHPNRSNSLSVNDKTELLAGQGTKDSPQHSNRISTSGSPSLPSSFSPGLFPLSTSSPFSSLFSGNVNLFSQQQQQQLQSSLTSSGGHHHHHQLLQQHNHHHHHQSSSSTNPRPAGTPTSSSSSVGSNSGGIPQQGMLPGSGLQNLPPHRIFNPEAYCDLCNKEFCNKYFLKTHKANKHGVYSEMSPSLGMGQVIGPGASNSPSNTSFLTGTPILSSAGLSATTTPQQQQSTIQGCSSAPSGTLSKGAGGIPSEIPFSLASFSLEKAAGNSNGSQQRESFCELCQKEFCNKYFLKRHKAKIHGIPIDCSSTGSGRSSSSSNHGKSSGGGGGNSGCPRLAFSNGMGGGENNSKREGLARSLRDIGLETIGLDMMAKDLEEAGGVMRNTDLGGREEGELSADESNAGMMMNARRESGKSPENVSESDENSSFKMSSLDFKLPQLGAVVNTENSCQFCFREFSSKQLLCNHLVKKHRLLIPSSFPPFLLPFPSLFEEQADSAALLDNNGNATTAEIDYECNLCNRSFQTIYLLRMHKSYFHPDSEDATDPVTSKFMSEAAASFLTKPPMITDEEGDNETGFNSDHDGNDNDSSGKASPNLADDNNKPSSKGAKNNNSLSVVEMEGRGEGTSDSDDLRRLQTMILELNRVSSTAVAWSPPLDSSSLPLQQQSGSSGGSSTICQICNKEFYSSYFLQQHIQHYHASCGQSANPSLNSSEQQQHSIRIKSESPHSNAQSVTPTSESPQQHLIRIKSESLLQADISSCGIGGGGGKKSVCLSGGDPTGSGSAISISQGTLKERLLHPDGFVSSSEQGGNVGPSSTFLTPGPKGNNNNTINKSDGANAAKRPSPSLSRSYCTICHKELCNKYFMRTHMLKMHGISIESSTGLGGVTCDICNKELCSKYFLKVHKQNTHGIVEDGPSPPNPSTPSPLPSVSQSPSSVNFPLLSNSALTGLNLSTTSISSEGNGPSSSSQLDPNSLPLLPKEVGDLQTRYFCHYSEVCPFCGRRFRSPKWLKTHLQSDHGEEGRERWKSIEKTLNLSRRQQQKSSSGKTNFPSSGQIKGSTPTSGGNKSNNPLLKTSGLTRDGNKCAFCNFSSSDMEVMKAHLIKEHGNQLTSRQSLSEAAAINASFQEASQSGMLLDPLTMLFQKMEGGSNKLYRCTYCPFTTSILVYLYAHERTHAGLVGSNVTNQQLTAGESPSPTFQCPMCFHAFDQPEAFQQHLIGHQMSGVLAPFFTPTTSASSGRLGFLSSPPGSASGVGSSGSGGDPSADPRNLLSLPLLNGNTSDNLYWALKNVSSSMSGKTNGERSSNKSGVHGDDQEEESNEPAADLTTNTKRRMDGDVDGSSGPKPRKREKISHFRCSYCQTRFKTREECLQHIHQSHNNNTNKQQQRAGGEEHQQQQEGTTAENPSSFGETRCAPSATGANRQHRLARFRKNFRCRKCKFTSSTYQMLVVHSKLQHSILRPTSHMRSKDVLNAGTLRTLGNEWKVGNLPEGHGIPQEGTVGDGEFLMQGFLLTSSEEESSNQSSGYFVPSLVYLPVREKVSQSIRVSFSLTPT